MGAGAWGRVLLWRGAEMACVWLLPAAARALAAAGASRAQHPLQGSRCPCPASLRAGVARTILTRLLLGLVGYGFVCAWFPFMPEVGRLLRPFALGCPC